MDKTTSLPKETFLVGISGGTKSLVAAYILKRQGYNVIGIGVLFTPKLTGDKIFQGVAFIDDIQKTKQLCHKLDIPFYAVNAQDIYKANVTEYLISSYLGGYRFSPESAVVSVIAKVLYSKMESLSAQKIATGHYAKIVHNHRNDSHHIYISRDEKDDQSGSFAFLPHKILKVLELPFSNMRREEVDKIASLLELPISNAKKQIPLTASHNLVSFIEQESPASLRKEGYIMDGISEKALGEHKGIHHFYLGQEIDSRDIQWRGHVPQNSGLICVDISPSSKIVTVIAKEAWVPVTHLILCHCYHDGELDISTPFNGYIKINGDNTKLFSTFYCLNNNTFLCELQKKYETPIFPKDIVVVYGGPRGDRILLSGFIFKAGRLDRKGHIRTLPLNRKEQRAAKKDENKKKCSDVYSFRF